MSTIIDLTKDIKAVLKDTDQLTNKNIKEIRRVARKASSALQKLRDGGLVGDDEAPKDETEEQKNERNQRALAAFGALTDDEEDNLDLYQRSCVLLRLESWTLKNSDGSDRPLPKTPDEVDDLPRFVYGPLTKAAADLNLNEDFSMEEGLTDPKAGTESSDA